MKRATQILTTLLLTAAVSFSQSPGRQSALALEDQGKIPEAESAWRALSKAQPANPEPYAHLGLLEARQQHYTEAVPLYRKALDLNPNVSGLRLNLALALFKGGQLNEAIPEFETLRKTAPPGSPDAQRLTILLGMAHYGIAQYPEAIPYLREAAAHDQQNLPLRLALAHSCLWSKQYQCVMDIYHEMLALNADSAEADMLAGEALDELKDNAGAVDQFRAAEKANPNEPNVHFGLGYLLWAQKRYPEAAPEFQLELANDPLHTQSLLYLGDTDLQLNKPEEARPLLEKAVQLDPSMWLADLDLGIIDSDAGRNDEALRELQLAENLKPDEVNVHWRLGRLYRTMGRKDEAKVELEKASKLNKAADEDLYQKINNGHPRSTSPQPVSPPSDPQQPAQQPNSQQPAAQPAPQP